MRVAFDEQIFAIQEFGGISRMFAELAKQFISDPRIGVDLVPLNSRVINHYVLDNPELAQALNVRSAGHSYAALMTYFTKMRPKGNVDVIHNTFYLPHGLAGYPGAKRVVTVHDMIPELLPRTRRRLDFLTLKKRYVKTADHVICVSEATRSDLLRTYGDIKAPISVVHHGVDPIFTPGNARPAALPENYILFVGNRGQYKDARVLLKSFSELLKQGSDLELVFVGGGAFTPDETREMEGMGIARRTHQFSLPDTEMAGAYGNAQVTVFPSRFEGFGLPALEAMACGSPTVLARATSLPEVGGDAALYFAPGDAAGLTARLSEISNSSTLQQELTTAGLARAKEFNWHRSAEQTADVYRQTLGEPR